MESTRDRILQSAYALFYRQGFSRVGMDAIAKRAGVTKRTIYYHFSSKDEVVAQVLAAQHLHLLSEFEEWAGGPGASASQIVENLFGKLKNWADSPRWLGSGFTRLTAELADLPGHPARKAAKTHKAAIEVWLAKRFDECGAKKPKELSRQIMVLIEGGMSLALIHGETDYILSSAEAARTLASAHKKPRPKARLS